MLRLLYTFAVFSLFILSSCASSLFATFTSDNVRPGMTKEQIISKFGKADRESFFKNEEGTLCEILYYTQSVNKGDTYYYDNILEFRDGLLIALTQGPEVRPSEKTVTIKKE